MPLAIAIDGDGNRAIRSWIRRAQHVGGGDATDVVLGRLTTKQNHEGGAMVGGVHWIDGTRH